ncbi:hypothetical protein SAMN05892883_0669 [Jatrophihabitans sp. GAS493]|uniref:hypothetical protein n=1 Tax=Jatrophihabitans sp. GAS493 TaxID=1907575 RepID=UPI000BB97FE1|nr:hypothetical protein [Jatrophihabitans sp. GAS493]SOD71077.1 hypothetical protein SAMN05892883_0669 [Jatrophihabitans sp. GAS493]
MRIDEFRESLRTRRKRVLFVSFAVLLVGGGAAVTGTLSTFTSTQSKAQSISSGTFTFALNDPGAGALFSTNVSGLAPGDFADRLVNVVNAGSINYGSVAIAVTAPTTSSLLDTDATNGLKLAVDDCSVPWTQASATVAATCSGTTTAETALTPVATLKATGPSYSTGLVALTGGTDYLRIHYNLPSGSTGTSGLTSVLNFAFTATQATGGAYH